ncbi:RTA1 like protein-domain-containing protein [Ampelomyces quisqualis]|uniref:RTA1 like protein-domain-containing protein n=1 Tax=Ampelomyces quisqualis TaxID=50730 RepID=A0A6A5QRU4_AMPQU|nr:RTA1 like protein-domain-containing protein [Ampelomyces quisqualis]
MPELQKYKGAVYIWDYVPSLPLAVAFAALFALVTAAHTWKMYRTRIWFCIPFVIGGIGEVAGYVCRVLAFNNTGSLALFVCQALLLLLPPVLFAASLYMVYSRVVRSVSGARFSLISPVWCTRIFVIGDWFCLNIQSTGGGLTANVKHQEIGDGIVVAGLALQILLFCFFLGCCVKFHINFSKHLKASGESTDVPWKMILQMLYATSAIISARNIFRLVEYIMGKGSYLFAYEWPIYVFDGALMLIVMVVFYVWYPDQLVWERTESMIELTSDGGDSERTKTGCSGIRHNSNNA